jgi:serine/threonine-protein kinase RsbW
LITERSQKGVKLTDTSNVVQLKIPASYQYLNLIGVCVAAMLEKVDNLTNKETLAYNIELAVHEICTNIVEHAYAGLGGTIALQLQIAENPQRFIIDITDSGQSFEIADVAKPTLEEPQIRGYGLFLVHELMNEVIYKPDTARNQWHLTKNL